MNVWRIDWYNYAISGFLVSYTELMYTKCYEDSTVCLEHKKKESHAFVAVVI